MFNIEIVLARIKIRFVKCDEKYYRSVYPDLDENLKFWSPSAHFRKFGWKEGRSPSAKFDTIAHLLGQRSNGTESGSSNRPFIRDAINNPVVPPKIRSFAKQYCEVLDSGLFDHNFYLTHYPNILGDPVEHFVRYGWYLGNDPGPLFSSKKYLQAYRDVNRNKINPLIHYHRYGKSENRIIYARDHTEHYIASTAEPVCQPIDIYRQSMGQVLKRKLIEVGAARSVLTGPEISILVPVYNVESIWLDQMISSVRNQSYENWQLCLVDDCSTSPSVRIDLEKYATSDQRITVAFRDVNGGISAATNDCLNLATGYYVALLDNDDMLTHDALEEMVGAIMTNDFPDWLYSDEFKISEHNDVSELFAKPDWSPSMLLNYMYTGHFTLYKTQVVQEVGGFRSEYDFSQDYDLALRVAERPGVRVIHVEKYLYAWRMIASSAAMGGKPQARISNIAALQDAIDRRGWNGSAQALPTANRVKRIVDRSDKVSIVIPSDNQKNIEAAIASILGPTSYQNFEIIVVTNSNIVDRLAPGYAQHGVIWQRYDQPFNFSEKCNRGVEIATGSYIVFFNDDVRVISQDWLESMLEYLTLPEVGVVGPKLLYENGLIQHSGMATGMRRLVGTAFHCYPDLSSAHFNFVQCVRDVSLICGAVLGMPTKLFRQIGGFDAVNAPINHSDVDLCFRVREAGYRCVYTPYAKLVHIGHASIGEEKKVKKAFVRDKSEVFLLKRFGEMTARDPYFTRAMRDLVYIDSPQDFSVYPALQQGTGRDVLVLSHDLTTSGAPKVAFDVAVLFRSRGHFVTVISPVDGPYRERLVAEGVTVIIDELVLTGNEDSMVLARSFDLVIANTIVCWPAVAALAATTPIYLYSHETELVRHFVNLYPGFLPAVKSATAVWCGSERAANAMAEFGVDAQILEYGVDDIASDVAMDKLQIALFGSIEPRKGQDLAILGLAKVDQGLRDQVQLTLYGRTLDVGFRAAIERLAEDQPEIRFGGELGYDEYRHALTAADIVIVCSRDDTLPLVSLDALALGKPLICSYSTGTSKYLEDGVSAVILKHNSPDEIGAAYSSLIASNRLRQTISKGGRGVFLRSFTKAAFAERVFSQIAEV